MVLMPFANAMCCSIYPYHTFEHVLELLRQASFDPSVLAIKINIYRVAKDSRIIDYDPRRT